MTLQYIYIGIGDHWVRCGNVYGNNYLPLNQERGGNLIVDKIYDATCVVCGKKISERECLSRDY